MPLHHARARKAEETAPPTGTPPLVSAPASSDLNGPCFDIASVERILIIAGQMQAQVQEQREAEQRHLSLQEVETLGRELNIDPMYIRRAMSQTQAELQAKQAQALAKEARRAARRKRLRTVAASLRAPLWCFVAMSVIMPAVFTPRPATNGLYFLLPLLIAFAVAMQVRGNKSAGEQRIGRCVWQGFWFGAAGLAAFFVNVWVHHIDLPDVIDFLIVLMAWLGSGAFAGVMGAALRSGFNTFLDAGENSSMDEHDT